MKLLDEMQFTSINVIIILAAGAMLAVVCAPHAQAPAFPMPPRCLPRPTAPPWLRHLPQQRYLEIKPLGIAAMQPGVTAYHIGKAGNVNYHDTLFNSHPNLPDVLVLIDGTKVTIPAQWKKRREEIKAFS